VYSPIYIHIYIDIFLMIKRRQATVRQHQHPLGQPRGAQGALHDLLQTSISIQV